MASIENAVNKLLALEAEGLVELSAVNQEHFIITSLGIVSAILFQVFWYLAISAAKSSRL